MSSGRSGSYPKFSLIKARITSEGAAQQEDVPARALDEPPPGPMRTGSQYVAGLKVRPSTPPPSDNFNLVEPAEEPSHFRPEPAPSPIMRQALERRTQSSVPSVFTTRISKAEAEKAAAAATRAAMTSGTPTLRRQQGAGQKPMLPQKAPPPAQKPILPPRPKPAAAPDEPEAATDSVAAQQTPVLPQEEPTLPTPAAATPSSPAVELKPKDAAPSVHADAAPRLPFAPPPSPLPHPATAESFPVPGKKPVAASPEKTPAASAPATARAGSAPEKNPPPSAADKAPTLPPPHKPAASAPSPLPKVSAIVKGSPIQKGGAARQPNAEPPTASSASPAPQSAPSPVILRSRSTPVIPGFKSTSIADQVTRALAGYVGGTVPTSEAPNVAARDAGQAGGPAAAAPSVPLAPLMRTAASVEAFIDGKTDGASLKERELAVALRNMQRAGWTFQTISDEQSDGVWVDAAAVYRFLLDDRRVVDVSTAVGDRVRLVDPRSDRSYTLNGVDEVASLDYFVGSGDPAALRHHSLAKRLQELSSQGLHCEADNARVPGLWGAYIGLARGERALLKVEGVVFGEIRGVQAADVDRAVAPLQELMAVYRARLLPEAQAGRLRQVHLGRVLQSLSWDVPQVAPERRTEAYLRLAEAVRIGPDASADAAERTALAARAYDAILELDLGGERFWEAVETMESLVATVGAAPAREPLHLLYREIGISSHFPQARQEREQVFRRVVACGLDPKDAVVATEQIVLRPWEEALESRVQLFEALAQRAAMQPSYQRVLHDFSAVVGYRSPQQSLEEVARPYLAIFEALAQQNKAEETIPTFALLHDGLRFGRLDAAHGSPGFDDVVEALAHRFVSLFKYSGDVAEARQRLLNWAPGSSESMQSAGQGERSTEA